jgi:3-hydroxyacyl-CoA dehydrogenase
MGAGRAPLLDDPAAAGRITTGSLAENLAAVADHDWICESGDRGSRDQAQAVERLAPLRRTGSVVSSNTSGIPLRALADGLPAELRRDLAVTHFFNPVKVMKLVELVPGETTAGEVLQTLKSFLDERLGKGVVHAKDTVNFIANRIGCFWMLAGLHQAKAALAADLSMEQIDALMGSP